jgi:predicted metal-dependent hydrolase
MTLAELPEIKISRNIRSTRLRLRVDEKQIKLTAPLFCSTRQINQFIEQSQAWLLKTWAEQQAKLATIDKELPLELKLFNLDKPITVEYVVQKNNFKLDIALNKLFISDRNPEQYLKTFVISYAKTYLPELLEKESERTGLTYTTCSIRQPKTRWGSCSMKKEIMLNSGLVLFNEDIASYVCIHELAHTKHFNHSADFWLEVAKHDSKYDLHRKILKKTPMPYWWTI